MFGQPKTQPRGNPGPPTNTIILAREANAMSQYDVVGAYNKDTDTPMILTTTMNKVDPKKGAEVMPFGVADGQGNPYPDRNYGTVAVTTHGPSTLMAKSIQCKQGETLSTGMCVYPCPFGNEIHVGTLGYLVSKAKDDPLFKSKFEDLKKKMQSQSITDSSTIVDLYMQFLRPFAMIVNYQPGSDFAQVMINPQTTFDIA